MSIRRCPYCKAIIDEQDKYCNNCGTQLLFPEDEFVEEDIPGDKIIGDKEEKEEKEEETEGEFEEEKSEEEETDYVEEEDKDLEHEEPTGEVDHTESETAGENELSGEDDLEAEKKEVEEPTPEELKEWGTGETQEELKEAAETKETADRGIEAGTKQDLGEAEKQQAEEEELKESPITPVEIEPPDKKYQISIEQDELVFKTNDLENLTRTVDEGKKELEEFLSAMQKKKQEEPAAAETKTDVPPWASEMKETPSAAPPTDEVRIGTQEVVPPAHEEWTKDSGIGIPEKVTQPVLPFGETTAQERKEKAELDQTDEAREAGGEATEAVGFSFKIKAKVVDLIFITALWLISLWFAAQVIGVSFFRLVLGSPIPVLVFYLILLLLYFFLFLYFLGETLGDHYFSAED
jgi:hypothetical protein